MTEEEEHIVKVQVINPKTKPIEDFPTEEFEVEEYITEEEIKEFENKQEE